MDYLDALKAEATGDPAGLGLAAPFAAGSDGVVSEALNLVRADLAVSRGTVPKDFILKALSRGLAGILGKPDTDPVRMQFAGWIELLRMASQIDTADAGFLATLGSAVTAGVFTQAEIDAASTRAGSRAEKLWGAGFTVAHLDVAAARGRA